MDDQVHKYSGAAKNLTIDDFMIIVQLRLVKDTDDGVYDGDLNFDKECDDGNSAPLDGCYGNLIEFGWRCDTTKCPNECTEIHGDGILVGSEVCDEEQEVECLKDCVYDGCEVDIATSNCDNNCKTYCETTT